MAEKPETPSPDPSRPAPRRRRFWLRAAYWLGVAAVWGGLAAVLAVVVLASNLPDTSVLETKERKPRLTILAADKTIIASYGDIYGEDLSLSEMPDYLPQAVIATEDRRFYSHHGVDPRGILRATFANLRAGRTVQGGSTITQQLAKNLFLTQDRTLARKVQEVILAIELEHKYSKQQILEQYLNRMYFGAGAFGVDGAAQRYFGVSAREVTIQQAAMLAGLVKAPSRLAPTRDLKAARLRAEEVLHNMVEAGFLTEEKLAKLRKSPAKVPRQQAREAPRYFVDYILDQLQQILGPNDKRDLTIQTTLDYKMQYQAEKAFKARFDADGPGFHAAQGALVAMSPDGAVRAMIGGRNYNDSQFNRAVQAKRQPGSAFKAFVYLAGMEAGLTPDTVMTDSPIQLANWAPKNYSGKFEGDMSLRQAFAHSVNTIAVKVAETANRSHVIAAARRLGITSPLTDTPSVALGTSEVSLLELTGAYAAFANHGDKAEPYSILSVRDDDAGKIIWRRKDTDGRDVIQPRELGLMNDLLQAVVTQGTGYKARLPDRPVGGKTGTSQDYRDAWFIGYTGDLVTGVWVGNDDNSPTRRMVGGSLPSTIWRDFMTQAEAGKPVDYLPTWSPAPEDAPPEENHGGGLIDAIENLFK